jgi:hypothetical protein
MPLGFGRNAFPLRFGGGDSIVEVEHLAMLDALAPGWDVSEDTEVYAEAYAHACAVSVIWAVNERLKNQAIPLRMLEALTTWEEATRSFPGAGDSANTRRRRVAAKLRGIAGNTLADITETCEAALGDNFVTIHTVDSADEIVFWPNAPAISGVTSAPGPPGYEWCTNRCRLWIELTSAGTSDGEFLTRQASAYNAVNAILPAWMNFVFFIDTGGFLVGVSKLGIDGL